MVKSKIQQSAVFSGKMYQLVPTLSHLCPPKFEPFCPYIEKVSALAACTEWRLFHLRHRNFYNFNCCWWKLWGGETESIYFPIMPLRLLLMALDKKMEEFQQALHCWYSIGTPKASQRHLKGITKISWYIPEAFPLWGGGTELSNNAFETTFNGPRQEDWGILASPSLLIF